MIVIAHNRYRSDQVSGENLAVEAEIRALEGAGIALNRLDRASDALVSAGFFARLRTGLELAGSPGRQAHLAEELRGLGAALVHCHNLFPLFGTDLWLAARKAGIPIVQTVHNHRLFATADRLLGPWGACRAGSDDEALHLARLSPLHGGRLVDRCYRRALTRAWRAGLPELVDTWIVHSSFHAQLLRHVGIPVAKIHVRLHAVSGDRPRGDGTGGHALFVGRLKREKGLDLLAAAWPASRPLQIIGSGPEAGLAQQLAGPGFRGPQPPAIVAEAMAAARFLVVCSRVYEGGGLPLVALEALAAGTPVLAPAIGALPELIAGRGVGWCYPPERPEALRAAILRAFDEAPAVRGRCLEIAARDHAPADWLASLRGVYQHLAPGSA